MWTWLQSIGLIPRSTDSGQARSTGSGQAKATAVVGENVKSQPSPDKLGLSKGGGGVVPMCSGRLFDILNPHPSQISLVEIAHGLSQINRFNGQTKFPYSVAQHSILCAKECLLRYPESYEAALGCLLHDAAEAYVCDVTRPIKVLIGTIYRPIEAAVQTAVFQHFDIEPTMTMVSIIKECDDALVMQESAVLMVGSERWDWGNTRPSQLAIEELMPVVVKQRFISEYNRLAHLADLLPATVPFRRPGKARLASPTIAV